MIFNNDKQSTQDVKKFLKNNPVGRTQQKDTLKPRRGTPGSPDNRILPIRGQ